MTDLIRCQECEGWGITSYEKDGSPNACEKCKGAGRVEPPPPIQYAREPLEVLATEALASVGCGATIGHGTSCVKGYTCSACGRLEKLATAAIEYLGRRYD